ncbi:hypothetical protein N9Z14_06560 [Opitutales bacterium]|nr:hypothetical protein [Opitutales bacterium]
MNRLRHMHFASPIKTVLIALVSLPLSAALIATASSLETDSPFLPSGYSNKKPAPVRPTPATNGPLAKQLEFRGVVQMNDTYEFSLFNKKENRGYWIPENGNVSGVSVRNFKLDSMTITVSLNGRTEQLTLMSATDSPLPVVASTVTKPPQLGQPPIIPGLNTNTAQKKNTSSRVIPRRRVILPKK